VKGNYLTARGVHGEPNPLLVGLLLHKATHFVGFHFQSLNQHVRVASDRLDIQMIGQCLKAGDEKA
jgi:hypothetical protein